MQHILLDILGDRPSTTMIALDETKFALDIPETPIELITLIIAMSDNTPLKLLSSVATSGRSCGCGLIFPGALTLLPVPAYHRYRSDAEITYDTKQKVAHLSGQEPIDAYFDRLCAARNGFVSPREIILEHPFQNAFSSGQEAWDLDEMLMTVCLGLWDETSSINPEVFSKTTLQSLGLFVGLSRLVPDEGRRFENYIGVTTDRLHRVAVVLHEQAAFICEQPIGSSRLMEGPRFADFNERARPYASLRELGQGLGRALKDSTETQVQMASYLAYEETPGIWPPRDGTFSTLDPAKLTSHERIAAIALKSDLLAAVPVRDAA